MQRIQKITHTEATEERFQELCAQILSIPIKHRPASLSTALSRIFGKSQVEVGRLLRTRASRQEFDLLVPESGWIHDYIEWTRCTEPPTVFHFFVAATVLGTALGRRVFFDKGAYQVFPNLCVMLIAPSGRCRKTSAANLGTGLYLSAGGTLIADKTTPEALIDALQGSANALIYAQELAVFLGKQKYQEGMVPLLTALFDCPKEWTSKTMGRGATTILDVSLGAIMCSTIDWLQTGVPSDSFGGGFMSRFLFVVQEHTSRCFPLPPPLNKETKARMIKELAAARMLKGQFEFTPAARRWYEYWYKHRVSPGASEKLFAGYYERKPDHIIRIAMAVKVSKQGNDFLLDEKDLVHADKVLSWLEEWLPNAFDQLTSSTVGEDQARILKQIRNAGGSIEHSALLRRNSSRLNAEQFRRAIETLKEAKLIEHDSKTRSYALTTEGWGG